MLVSDLQILEMNKVFGFFKITMCWIKKIVSTEKTLLIFVVIVFLKIGPKITQNYPLTPKQLCILILDMFLLLKMVITHFRPGMSFGRKISWPVTNYKTWWEIKRKRRMIKSIGIYSRLSCFPFLNDSFCTFSKYGIK